MRLLLILLVFPFSLFAEKRPLLVEWSFQNVREGFDYASKVTVYIDGEKFDDSPVFLQSATGSYEIDVQQGNHEIRVECYARFQGGWELYSTKNDYAIDAILETKKELTKETRLKILWDVEGKRARSSFRRYRSNAEPLETIEADINWTTLNLNPGFDFKNMCIVFVDGRQVGYSGSFLQSEKGELNFKIAPGKHTIVIENYVYTGKWELQSKMNDYAVDAFTKIRTRIEQPVLIDMTFDIAAGTTTILVK